MPRSPARLTSIHKLVAIAAIAAGDLDYEDPTKHPRVGVAVGEENRSAGHDVGEGWWYSTRSAGAPPRWSPAERLGREWAGIDIDEVAVGITQKRLQDGSDAAVHNVDLDGLREGLPSACTYRRTLRSAPIPTLSANICDEFVAIADLRRPRCVALRFRP